MQSIRIENGILKSNNKNIQIDLGGYAKGYALDQAKKILKNNNVNNALINIGGNILAFGKYGERNWVVGIQNPRKPNVLATIALKPGWAIGTSGDYQRYIMVNNQRYSHLINPKTGYPEIKHNQLPFYCLLQMIQALFQTYFLNLFLLLKRK